MKLNPPRKRRTTLSNIPHLRAFLKENERPVLLRVGFDALTRHLVTKLSELDDVAEATWFAQLAYRLLKEKGFVEAINAYADKDYFDLPRSPIVAAGLFTIPDRLKTVIEHAAEKGPFVDARGVTSQWLRAAICYVAFVEKKIALASLPKHLFIAP